MIANARTPVSLVTGFLGSGKTTLVNRLLVADGMADTAVIVNEFGAVGIDHDLVAASDDAIILLANGCLCCAVRGDLVRTLDELHRRRAGGALPPFARVLIETSGLADPGPVIQALLAEPTLRARYTLGGVVTVVDAINGPATLASHVEALKQVAVADRIVVTKLDLVHGPRTRDETTSRLRERLARINPAADIVVASMPLAPDFYFDARAPEDIGGAGRAGGWLKADRYPGFAPAATGASAVLHDSRVRSTCVVRDQPMTEAALRLLVDALSQNLGASLLRVKGLIAVAGRPDTPAVLHGAQAVLHDVEWLDCWPGDDRRTRIVFITLDRDPDEARDLVDLACRLAGGAARARAGERDQTASPPPIAR